MPKVNFEAPDPRKLVHLVNDTSAESEGDYDEPTAAILLRHSVGWRVADAVTSSAAHAAPDTSSGQSTNSGAPAAPEGT